MPPRSIIKGLMKPLAARFAFETFRNPQAGQARLDALLPEGVVIKLLALAFAVRDAASTTAVRDLALRIVAMLEDEEHTAQVQSPAPTPPAPPAVK